MSTAASRRRVGLWLLLAVVLGVVGWAFFAGDDDEPTMTETTASQGKRPAAPKAAVSFENDETPRGYELDALERAKVSGRVVDSKEQPIANAIVCAWLDAGRTGSTLAQKPRCSKTGPKGNFDLEDLPATLVRITANAPGFFSLASPTSPGAASVQLHPGQHAKGVVLQLENGGVAVRGVVHDAAGGLIEGATVTGYRTRAWAPESAVGATTMSGFDGEFELWLQAGPIAVRAISEDYAPAMVVTAAPNEGLELWLVPASKLVGTVRWAEGGGPVANARVVADEEFSFTDETGRFEISNLRPGTYKVEAAVRGGRGMAAQSVSLGLGEQSDPISILMHQQPFVRGRVVASSSETPCAEGVVRLEDAGQWYEAPVEVEGIATFDAVLPGTYNVRVECKSSVPGESYPAIEVGGENIDGLVWEVEQGYAVAGRVELSTGDPVPGVSVWADGGHDGGTATTDAEGVYRIEGLASGDYRVIAHEAAMPDPPIQDVSVKSADVEGVVLIAKAGAQLSGVVVDGAGGGVGGAVVVVTPTDLVATPLSAPSDGDGKFSLSGLRPGPHNVRVDSKWGTSLLSDEQAIAVTLSEGANDGVVIEVSSADASISGECEDGEGNPVADAFVEVRPETESALGRREFGAAQPVMTDAEGAFAVDGLLPDATYTLRCSIRGGASAEVAGVNTNRAVTIVLDNSGSVSGTVKLSDGTPSDSFEVTLIGLDGATSRNEAFFHTDGAWTIEGVATGSHRPTASSSQGKGESAPIQVIVGGSVPGVGIEIKAFTKVHGRVVDLETGDPIKGMLISARPGREMVMPGWGEERTNAEGKFEIDDVQAGRLLVTGADPYWPRSKYSGFFLQVTAVAGKDNDLGDIRHPKGRHDFEKGPGDLGFGVAPPADAAHEGTGVRVVTVRPSGPAEAAGIAVGDGLVAVDGYDITGPNQHLFYSLARVDQGTTVEFERDDGDVFRIVARPPPSAE